MIKLKSLLSESVQKLVVYHGTGESFKTFDFKKAAQGIIWFTSNKDKILKQEVGAAGKGYIITAEVTFKKPAGWEEYDKLGLSELERNGYDGAILKNDDGFDGFVMHPKQIKILKIEKV